MVLIVARGGSRESVKHFTPLEPITTPRADRETSVQPSPDRRFEPPNVSSSVIEKEPEPKSPCVISVRDGADMRVGPTIVPSRPAPRLVTEVVLNGLARDLRVQETNLGDLFADSLMWQVNQPSQGLPKADIALMNGAGIQSYGTIPQGPISQQAIQKAAAWDDFACVIPDVPVSALKETLEDCLNKLPEAHTGFPQVAGFKLTYDVSGRAQARDQKGSIVTRGARVKAVTLDSGRKLVVRGVIVPGARPVTLATTDYIAKNYAGLKGLHHTVLQAHHYRNVLRDFIASDSGLRGVVRAADYPESGHGRIIRARPSGSSR